MTNKLITRMRAGRRLQLIKRRFEEHGVHSRADAKRLVAEDWKNAHNTRLEDSGESQTDIRNVKFSISFNTKNLIGEVRLPIEFDNIASFIEKVEVEPVI